VWVYRYLLFFLLSVLILVEMIAGNEKCSVFAVQLVIIFFVLLYITCKIT